MKSYHNKIPGWFDFERIYTDMVNKYPDGSHFVEIGSWLGKSTVFMGTLIANSKKNIIFDAVDIWEVDPLYLKEEEVELYNKELKRLKIDNLYDAFLKNIEPLKKYINPIKMSSEKASLNYKEKSLDFIFIDGAHDYDSVFKDLEIWYPKLKESGIIAGHDYHSKKIKRAVHDFFGEENIVQVNMSWKLKNNIKK